MVRFSTTILKFGEKGEKTGWSYIKVPASLAQKLKPGNKKSFRVKATFDACSFEQLAMIPMGSGDFIIAVNAAIRKAIRKQQGAKIDVMLEAENKPIALSHELVECLQDEPAAKIYFYSLPKSHQMYFSKWIESAKTEPTKAKRISYALAAMIRKKGFAEMLRSIKAKKDLFDFR